MSTIVQLTTVPADLIGAQALPMPKPVEKDKKSRSASSRDKPADDCDHRLVIREGIEAGVFIYTVLDRVSGKVMVQVPREDVATIASRPDYSAGQVIDTKV